jgi:hypothetical protein
MTNAIVARALTRATSQFCFTAGAGLVQKTNGPNALMFL